MHNHPYGFEIYLVNVKTIKTIAHIFVAFSEKLNFPKNINLCFSNISSTDWIYGDGYGGTTSVSKVL